MYYAKYLEQHAGHATLPALLNIPLACPTVHPSSAVHSKAAVQVTSRPLSSPQLEILQKLKKLEKLNKKMFRLP